MKIYVDGKPLEISSKQPMVRTIIEASGHDPEKFDLYWLKVTRPDKQLFPNFQVPIREGKQFGLRQKKRD